MNLCVCVCSVEFVPRYIKTSGNATVDHLSKYLAVRLALEELRRNAEASPVNVEAASEKQYTIYIPTAGNQFTVSTHTTLDMWTQETDRELLVSKYIYI